MTSTRLNKVKGLCCIGFLLQLLAPSTSLPVNVATDAKRLYLSEGIRQDNRLVLCGLADMKMSFPNLDYAFSGYDVVKGYPLTMARDPGFRNAIFKADYTNGKSNGDCRYILPKGISALADVSCDVSFKSDIIKTKAEFHNSLSVSANIQGGGFGFEFSASASYQKATSDMSSKEFVYIISKAQCTSYFSRVEHSSPPPFSDGFLEAAKVLAGAGSTDKDVQNFVDTYGTHYLEEVTFGSSYTQEHRMSSSTYNTLSNEKFGVGVQASYSGAFSVGGGFNMDSEQQQAASNFAKSVETSTVTVGSAPPSDGDAMTWASVVKENPVPIKYNLRPIADLFTARFLSDSGIDYNTVHGKLENAPRKSCELLKSQGKPVSCEDVQESESSDVITITGGYPHRRVGEVVSYNFYLASQTGCELMCNSNNKCVGFITFGVTQCRLVMDGGNHQWEISSRPFKLYLSKMEEDIIFNQGYVPKAVDGSTKLYAYKFTLPASQSQSSNKNECRNVCIRDVLCKAFRYGREGSSGYTTNCHLYHQISNLPSEYLSDTEFRFVAK